MLLEAKADPNLARNWAKSRAGEVAVGQNLRYLFGAKGFWDVHRGTGDPLPGFFEALHSSGTFNLFLWFDFPTQKDEEPKKVNVFLVRKLRD